MLDEASDNFYFTLIVGGTKCNLHFVVSYDLQSLNHTDCLFIPLTQIFITTQMYFVQQITEAIDLNSKLLFYIIW